MSQRVSIILLLAVALPSSYYVTHCSRIMWVPGKDASKHIPQPSGVRIDPAENYHVARTEYKNGILLGRYSPKQRGFYFPFQGNEISINSGNTQLLTYEKGVATWMKRETGDAHLPHNMVLGGIHPISNEHLFVCRAHHDNALIPGQMTLDEDKCRIGWMSKEHVKERYELLALSLYGIARNATG